MIVRPLLLAALAAVLAAGDAPPVKAPVLWFHVMHNLNNDEANVELFRRMERAAKAGYTGISFFDSRFLLRDLQTPKYLANVAAFRAKATELKLQVAACVTPIGYAEEMLHNDPSLHEGFPVRGAPFVVRDGALVPDDAEPKLANGGFEEVGAKGPTGWEVDDFGSIATIAEDGAAEGRRCLKVTDPKRSAAGHARAIQHLRVHPWRDYHVSLKMKTKDNDSRDMRIMALGEFPLDWTPLDIQPTMDWKQLDIVFNSLDREEVNLYIGTWGARGGTYWIDDVRIEPAGFDNVIRRDDLPLTIASEDGRTTYVEGRDFAKIADPLLDGRVTAWHAQPKVAIPAGSALKEGQRVLATFHHAMNGMTTNNSAICPSTPGTYVEIEKEIRFVAEHVKPDVYFFQHDEMRILGWDDCCAKRKLTTGEIIADNMRKCVAIVEKVDPGKPMVVWNDMFDPHHNAHKPGSEAHFLVKGPGTCWESWKGLPKRVGVVNWNNGNVDSVKFFSAEGHPQILSFDQPDGLKKWCEETRDQKGIVGAMYTTWENDWSRLEAYADVWKAQFKAGAK